MRQQLEQAHRDHELEVSVLKSSLASARQEPDRLKEKLQSCQDKLSAARAEAASLERKLMLQGMRAKSPSPGAGGGLSPSRSASPFDRSASPFGPPSTPGAEAVLPGRRRALVRRRGPGALGAPARSAFAASISGSISQAALWSNWSTCSRQIR